MSRGPAVSTPRELATAFTDTEKHFVSEASVYRILEAHASQMAAASAASFFCRATYGLT